MKIKTDDDAHDAIDDLMPECPLGRTCPPETSADVECPTDCLSKLMSVEALRALYKMYRRSGMSPEDVMTKILTISLVEYYGKHRRGELNV